MKRVLLLLLFIALPPTLHAQSLHWESLAVRAKLDEQGRLHVVEEQAMVFDGDWNGGERKFRVERDQTLELVSVVRRDANGQLIPLREGSLANVDEYSLSGNTLRWRSRLPSDPPFANARLVYVLSYILGGSVLDRRGDGYVLNHDFAFRDRSGVIEKFTLDLEFADVWRSAGPAHYEAAMLAPGKSFVVRQELEYGGDAAPAAAPDTRATRYGLIALLVAIPLILWRRFISREDSLGRFAPLTSSTVDRGWIEKNLLELPPEVAGAAWDEQVTRNEVAALIARWTAEKKISTTIGADKEMSMMLLVDRGAFEGYERELIDKLFFEGNTTSTKSLESHYARSGFDPSTVISEGLTERFKEIGQMKEAAPPVSPLPSLVLFVTGVAATVFGLVRTGRENVAPVIGALIVMLVAWIVGVLIAYQWRARIDWGLRGAYGFAAFAAIAVAAAAVVAASGRVDLVAHAGLALLALMVTSNIFNVAKSKRGRSALAFRKRLASVRQYFIDELQKPQPAIDDAWFPWVIAFGLDNEATRWAAAFGGSSSTGSSTISSSGSSWSSSSGGSSSSWSGGGGAFGGAGATASWAAAAGGIAAGVTSASSSSGGSSGGGGSSSGGGGGGGW